MSDSFIQVPPDSTGKLVDCDQLTVGANTVQRERDRVAGAGAAELADVKNADPAANLYGLVVRSLPAKSSTASGLAQFSVTTGDQVLLASNANRRKAIIQNTGTSVIKLGYGAAATQTAYTIALAACGSADDGSGGSITEESFTGAIHVIGAASGSCVVTELT